VHPAADIMAEVDIPLWAVIRPRVLEHLPAIYRRREQDNTYPALAHTPSSQRWNPAQHLSGVQSILVAALPYNPTGWIDNGRTPLSGTVSRYAWGRDYHSVLEEKLQQAADLLQSKVGVGRWFAAVDKTPLPDRELAVEARLGCFGWNSCVYCPPFGSRVVLGSLSIDKKLPVHTPPQKPSGDCGVSCSACMQSCPTGAIREPYYINPYICLAYLTQASGVFPRLYRPLLGQRIWGCDTCQDVCPMNQRAEPAQKEYFAPLQYRSLPLPEVLQWSHADFRAKLGKTALGWRGKNILQRNAALALGNSGSSEALPPLQDTVERHGSAVVRASALWAMGRLQPASARRRALQLCGSDIDPIIRQEAQYWL